MNTILCAVDLTEAALPVVGVAASLARSLHMRLELLHVVHLPPGLPPEYLSDNVIVDVRLGATKIMEARAAELQGTGIDVWARVALGLVDDGILERARELDAGLLVLGTHARQGVARAFVGSVAERIVRAATCPIVVVPPSAGGRLARGESVADPLKIVAGIDGSPASDAALSWLRAIDQQARCDLRLVHHYWPPREHERLGLGRANPFEPDPEVVSVLTRELRVHVAAHLGRENVALRVRPYWGAEDDPLAWEAEADGADLLVVGTSQERPSTALATIRGAHLPVVCVPGAQSETAPKRIAPVQTLLVPTDFSPLGNAAVQEAYRLLMRGGGEVVLFHVAEADPIALAPQRRSEIETSLLALVPYGMDARAIRTRTSVAADRSPGDAIVQAINRLGPDLVVMSSHGRSGLARALRGSVAEHVMRVASTPVLIVPASAEPPTRFPEDQV